MHRRFALDVPAGFTLDVIILMDGVKRGVPHASTRKYLTRLFGVEWGVGRAGEDQVTHPGLGGQELCQTTIIESLKWYNPRAGSSSGGSSGSGTTGGRRGLMPTGSYGSDVGTNDVNGSVGAHRDGYSYRENFRVSVLIKKRNLRKHNSHQWFMDAFAKELNCKYILCTDCSTVFERSMLCKLTANLEANPSTTAVCGRQRVMSVRLQNEGSGKPLR